jgi:outer membrane protein assembly factor BamB
MQHTSRVGIIGPQSLKVKWTFNTGGTVWGPVVGRDGTVYVPSNDGFLYAVNRDGTEKWRFDLQLPPNPVNAEDPTTPSQHAVIGNDGTIYVAGLHLFAVNPDGTEKWHFEASGTDPRPGLTGFQTPTIGVDDTIYQPSTNGTLYAVDEATGKEKWSKVLGGGKKLQAPISFDWDGNPIVSVRKGGIPNVFKLDKDGNTLWSFTGPDEMRSATVGDDGTLYVAAKLGTLFALNGKTGEELWHQDARDAEFAVMEFPALGQDGSIIQGSGEGELASYSPTGEVNWKFESDENTTRIDPKTNLPLASHMGTPVVDAAGTLYVPSPLADLWMVGQDGKLVQRLESPALFTRMAMGADGTLYSGSLEGILYAIGDDDVLGDGDGDKQITVADAVEALKVAVGMTSASLSLTRCLDVADSGAEGRPFGDGEVAVDDAVAILKNVVAPLPNFPYGQ